MNYEKNSMNAKKIGNYTTVGNIVRHWFRIQNTSLKAKKKSRKNTCLLWLLSSPSFLDNGSKSAFVSSALARRGQKYKNIPSPVAIAVAVAVDLSSSSSGASQPQLQPQPQPPATFIVFHALLICFWCGRRTFHSHPWLTLTDWLTDYCVLGKVITWENQLRKFSSKRKICLRGVVSCVINLLKLRQGNCCADIFLVLGMYL